MDAMQRRPGASSDGEVDQTIRTALSASLVALPPGFLARVMADVGAAPHPARRAERMRLALVDVAVPAGVAMLALLVLLGVAWLRAVDPTIVPRAAHWAEATWSVTLPGVPRPAISALALTSSAAGLAALVVALITERHRPMTNARVA